MGLLRTAWFGAVITVLLVACSGPASQPEEALQAWVAAAEAAAEDKDRRALMAMISPDYADARGNDREAVDRIFRWWFMRQKSIALLVKTDGIEMFQDTAAELRLSVGMAATNGNTVGINADVYRFELDMQRVDDEWMLIGARWGELGQELK